MSGGGRWAVGGGRWAVDGGRWRGGGLCHRYAVPWVGTHGYGCFSPRGFRRRRAAVESAAKVARWALFSLWCLRQRAVAARSPGGTIPETGSGDPVTLGRPRHLGTPRHLRETPMPWGDPDALGDAGTLAYFFSVGMMSAETARLALRYSLARASISSFLMPEKSVTKLRAQSRRSGCSWAQRRTFMDQ